VADHGVDARQASIPVSFRGRFGATMMTRPSQIFSNSSRDMYLGRRDDFAVKADRTVGAVMPCSNA
jgi:hypothetical protein